MSLQENLPKGWTLAKLGDIADYLNGRAFKPSEWEKTGAPIVRIQNLNNPDAAYNYSNVEFEERYGIEKGELLFAWSASLGAHIWKGNKAWLNQHIFKVIPRGVDKMFLYYLLDKITTDLYAKTHGSGMVHVTKGKFEDTEVPIPPLPEQQRIVAKIEELFSDLDKGIETLKTAQQQLKVYRHAVLKWAFEGKLIDSNTQTWKKFTLEQVTAKITDGEHFRPVTVAAGIPFLSAKDVRENGVSFENNLYISQETAAKALQRCNPTRGDILIVSRGATVGRMCIVETDKPFCLLGSVILLKTNEIIKSKYLLYFLKSAAVNQQIISVSGATAQQAIYLRDIKKIGIAVPPNSIQDQIITEIETRLSLCANTEDAIIQTITKSEALRQSILKKAFEGKLVAQDCNDEQAHLLLARIRGESKQLHSKAKPVKIKNPKPKTPRAKKTPATL